MAPHEGDMTALGNYLRMMFSLAGTGSSGDRR